MTKLIGAFRDYANAPKKLYYRALCTETYSKTKLCNYYFLCASRILEQFTHMSVPHEERTCETQNFIFNAFRPVI
jgi:hypothetical protein